MKKIIKEIIKNNLCLGCGLCQSIDDKCKMEMTEDGFYKPSIVSRDKIVNDKIAILCPAINVINTSKAKEVWGDVKASYVAWSSDERIRKLSSSGGLISSLLIYLLEQRKVDGILQVGSTDFIHNELVVNRCKDDILKCNNSRYAPALVFSNILQILESNQTYAFVGKPCDIAVIRNLQRMYPKLLKKIPYLLSLFCAGMPSLNATLDLLKLSGEKKMPQTIKYRGDGWPGVFKATYNDDEVFTMSYNDSWGKVLGRQLSFRCKICPDGIGLLADISAGDAWNTKDGYPDFEESDGRNFCLIRNENGLNLFNDALKDGYIIAEKYALTKIDEAQPYQYNRRLNAGWRILAVQLMSNHILKFKGLNLMYLAKMQNIKIGLLEFIGTIHRFIKNK